jgi:hypothetical protein
MILGGQGGLTFGQNKVAPAFTLRLPRDVRPEIFLIDIDVVVRGKGLSRTRLDAHAGTFEYAVPYRYGNSAKVSKVEDVLSLSLFIYAPGYQAIQREFQTTELKALRVYDVVLEKQRTTVLQGQLVDTQLRPLAGQTIQLKFDPGCDNPDCIFNPIEIAKAMTGIDGTFQFDAPLLADTDAMFHKHQYGTSFYLTTDVGILRPVDNPYPKAAIGWFEFPAQTIYPARMTVMRIIQGRISGKLGPLLLKQNKLPKNLKSYLKDGHSSIDVGLEVGGVAGVFVRPSEDGRFGISVLPGTYGLSLHVVRGKTSTDIRIAEGIVIAEGQSKIIQLP